MYANYVIVEVTKVKEMKVEDLAGPAGQLKVEKEPSLLSTFYIFCAK
jgi:hypothetical protein